MFPGCVVLGHTNEDDYHGPRKNMDILQNVNIGENWLRNNGDQEAEILWPS